MMRIALEFPDGWEVANSAEQVMAREPGTKHFMLLQHGGSARAAAPSAKWLSTRCARPATNRWTGRWSSSSGLDAYVGVYRGSLNGVGKVTMRAAHVAMGRQVYVFAGFAPDAEFDQVGRDHRGFDPDVPRAEPAGSGAGAPEPPRPTTPCDRAIRGSRSRSVPGKGITNAATLAIMNGLEVYEQPQPGERVKIVVEG